MAVLCREHRLLYLGNKRTGSTAVGRALELRFGGIYLPSKRFVTASGEVVSRRHSTLRQVLEHGLLDVDVHELCKFTTVRNPFDSLVSLWAKLRFRANRAGSWVHSKDVSFATWVEKRFGDAEPTSMHADFAEGADAILRFERLSMDLSDLVASLGLPPIVLEPQNTTVERIRDYRSYYDDRTRAIVERVFRDDLDRFDYSF